MRNPSLSLPGRTCVPVPITGESELRSCGREAPYSYMICRQPTVFMPRTPLFARIFQKPKGKLDVMTDGDEDGLHDVYNEGLGAKFRQTEWKKPSQGGRKDHAHQQ